MDEFLCFGDFVSLYCDERGGYVFSNHSSSVFNEVAVSSGGHKKKSVDDNVSMFEICPATRYQFSSHYKNQSTGPEQQDSSSEDRSSGVVDTEQSFNAAEIKRQRGRPVCYGQTIQFRHKFTHKFVQISKLSTSSIEPENNTVLLQPRDSIDGQFKVLPKHKNRKEGDQVCVYDRVLFESISSPSHYLHVSEAVFNHDHMPYNKCYELNMCPDSSTFSMWRNAAPLVEDETLLKSGDVLRFFHNELQGYLVAEGSYSAGVRENVHLRLRPLKRDKQHSLQPSSSAITYWQVELATSDITDGYIKQSSSVRLLHMCTGQYLCIDHQNKVSLTQDTHDKGTLFKLVSMDNVTDNVLVKSCYSLQNTQTGRWILASKDMYKRRQKDDVGDKRHIESLKVSNATLMSVSMSNEQVIGESLNEKQLDDLFLLEPVSHTDYLHCTFVSGMVPYLSKKHIATVQDEAVSRKIIKCFEEMISFISVDGKPVKARQKLFRNLGIIDRLLEMLHQTFSPDNKHMKAVFALVYDLLRAYVRGESRKNKTHLARNISLFFNHFSYTEGHVNQHAIDLVNEFTRDNVEVVEKITNDDMTKLVDSILKEKEYRFLELMNNFCVCQGRAVEDNQKYFASSWLNTQTTIPRSCKRWVLFCMEKVSNFYQNCLYFTKMGDELNKPESERGDVFITVDNARTWLSLVQLTKEKDKQLHCQFFYHQLETFERLCYGQNEHTITILTSDSKYNLEVQADRCMKNTELPDDLRALYCQLFIALFVDTKDHNTQEERPEDLYLYKKHVGYETRADISTEVLDRLEICQFVVTYLANPDIQTSIQIPTNKMTGQILRLLNHLTRLGKLEINDHTTIHLMNLLNGKTDQPEKETPDEIKTYRQTERFKKSESTAAVVETKIQCLMVFDTYFSIVLKRRLKCLMDKFEKLSSSSMISGGIMDPGINLEDRNRFKSEVTSIIQELFAQTSIFSGLDLPAVLLDLTRYEYESLVTKTMETFHSYYTAIQSLLKHAQKVQVLVDPTTVQRCEEVRTTLSAMRGKVDSKISDADLDNIVKTLGEFAVFCKQEDSERPHTTLQNYLSSQGILEVIFKLLSAKDHQDQDMPSLQIAGFHLLERLTRDNVQIQVCVFNKLDLLLTMEHQIVHIVPVIKTVFVGNREVCKRITDEHVQIMIRYLTDDRHRDAVSTIFDVIQTIILPDKFGVPVRQNQHIVMRHMTQIRCKISQVFGLSDQQLLGFIADPDLKKVTYFLSTVNLMASCSQDGSMENKAALCSTFDVSFLLKTVTAPGVSFTRVKPFLRCLMYGYCQGFNVDESKRDSKWFTVESDKLEALVKRLEKDSTKLSEEDMKLSEEMIYQMIVKSSSDFTDTDLGAKLLYHLDTVVPFCQCVCSWLPAEDISSNVKSELRNLGTKLKGIMSNLDPGLLPSEVRSQLVDSLISLKQFTKWEESIEDIEQKYSTETEKTVSSDYDKEQEVNKQFQTFIQNLWLAAGVSHKPNKELWTSVRKRKEDFASLEQKVELKTMYEFFLSRREKTQPPLEITAKIVSQLNQIKSRKLHGELLFPQPDVHLGYMQTLRSIILAEIVKLPPDFELFLHKNRGELRRVDIVQGTLIQYGAIECALQDLNPQIPNTHLIEALQLVICLVFHGNVHTQNAVYKFFIEKPDIHVKGTLQSRLARFRDFILQVDPIRHTEMSKSVGTVSVQQQQTTTTATEVASDPSSMSDPDPGSSNGDNNNNNNNRDEIPLIDMSTNGVKTEGKGKFGIMKRGKNVVHPLLESGVKGKLQPTKIDISMVDRETLEVTSVILEFVTALCQNQHTQLQNYFREQFPIELSTNFIEVLVEIIDTIHTRINSTTVMVAVQAYDCLTQIVSGNTENKSVVLGSRVCEQTNFMLYMTAYRDCSLTQIYKLKKAAGSFWRAMTEDTCIVITKSGDSNADLAVTAIEYLDAEVILLVVKQAFQEKPGFTKRKLQSLVTSVGFQYCALLHRKLWKVPALSKEAMLKTEEDLKVYKHYSESIRCVEILKDDAVHKVFFRVQDKRAFSTDIKERIQYEVDRSSHIEKIKDFMKWSADTTDHARNRWNLCRSPIGKLLAYSWLPVNYFMLILTVAILIMISVDYNGGNEATTKTYELDIRHKVQTAVYVLGGVHNFVSLLIVICFILPTHVFLDSISRYELDIRHKVQTAVYVLGGVHNFVSLLIVICFILLNQPQFHGLVHMFEVTKSILERRKENRETEVTDKRTSSRLKISAYGPMMIYYTLFLAASICGTALHGLTFVLCFFQLFELNRHLKRIGRSVIYNAKYLGMLILIGLVILYIYAMLAFIFMRRNYILQSDGHYCNSMPQCFVTMLHHGLVGTTYNMIDHSTTSSFSAAVLIGLYNISFFMIITVLGLYMVFAILIDGFLHIKQNMRRAKDDFKAVCFICGRSNADFSLDTKGYDDHVKNDHNIWDYIYFFIHLDTTMASEYTALENYVHKQIQEGKFDFLPIQRAMCLEERDKARKKSQTTGGINMDNADKGDEKPRKRLQRLPSFQEAPKLKERKAGKGAREDAKYPSETGGRRKSKPAVNHLELPDIDPDHVTRDKQPQGRAGGPKSKPATNERRLSEKPKDAAQVSEPKQSPTLPDKPLITEAPKSPPPDDTNDATLEDKTGPRAEPVDDFGDFFDDQDQTAEGFDHKDISQYKNRNEDPNRPKFLDEKLVSREDSSVSLI